MRKIYFSIVLLFVTYNSFSQVVRCYTDEMDLQLRNQFPQLETKAQFESWLDSTINSSSENRIIGGVYQIPVVFHVVHNGESVGSGTNISYAAIQSQVDVLNEDFRKQLNSNGYNTNAVGADTEIEFCLAKRRPDGSAFPNGEDGVNRISRSAAGFTSPPYSTNYVNSTIKNYTYNGGTATATRGWVPTKYMNIWICNLSSGILGYAQFPESPLGGIGCGATAQATDGVVFLYSTIGKSSVTGFPDPYNEGRTATHEIGHWLGLRHIWGDGGCTVDDFCNDTPEAGSANYGCPTGTNSCSSSPGNDMIENYMDYTDDLCMNIFTNDQKTRMRTVLESSPLRVSLINSDACIPPNLNDASIIDILNPKGDNCAGSIIPSVTIRNRGTNNLTSAIITYQVDNGTVTNFNFSGNVIPGASATVALPAFTSYLGTHNLKVFNSMPNGVIDPSTEYDTTSIDFVVSNGINAPFVETFEGNVFPPSIKWVVENTNSDCYEWLGASATSIAGVFNNNAALFPGFGNTSGSTDNLVTPIFILPCNATGTNIQFDVAYRRRNSITSNYDRLYIEISEDCGNTWNATPIYDKTGTSLQVLTTTTTTYYTPVGATDWRTETIDLSSFVTGSSKNVKFRFRSVAADGNNVYIDNFKFNAVSSSEAKIVQNAVEILDDGGIDFGAVAIGNSLQKTFTITNTGTGNLTLNLPVSITGTAFTLVNSNLTPTLASGASATFDIVFSPTNPTSYSETFSLTTNDCDEGIYNFLLLGRALVNTPIADFNASTINTCVGTTIQLNNTSSAALSYAWDFGPNATPTTSTSANPTVSFSVAGTYDVTLVATNASGSNTMAKSAYITVNPNVTPMVTISSDDVDNTICSGTAVNFSASVNNGGTTPTYQWKINTTNAGTSSALFSSTNLANGDVVTCIITSNQACASPTSATSNGIIWNVTPSVTPTITVNSDDADNVICSGTTVNFSFTNNNQGNAPTYQWKVNGNVVSTGSTYSDATLANNDIVTCELTSNAICANPSLVSSLDLIMTVNSNLDPTISIASSDADNTICSGSSVTFTASITNSGTNPSFQWFVNGAIAGTNNSQFTNSTLATADVVSCEVISNSTCAATNTALSSGITTTVNQTLVPSVTIVSNDADNSITSGTSVTFTATAVNGGSNPSFQWKVNGANVGTNSNTFTSTTLANNAVVTCVVTSNYICPSTPTATSNSVTMTVQSQSGLNEESVVDVNHLAFPNPFKTSFSLKAVFEKDTKITISITDITGKLIENIHINSDELAELKFGETYRAGMYHVTISSANFVKLLKVVKN